MPLNFTRAGCSPAAYCDAACASQTVAASEAEEIVAAENMNAVDAMHTSTAIISTLWVVFIAVLSLLMRWTDADTAAVRTPWRNCLDIFLLHQSRERMVVRPCCLSPVAPTQKFRRETTDNHSRGALSEARQRGVYC
jgi:hypothetical protein